MASLLFEAEEGTEDTPIYVGMFNGSVFEVYQRDFEEDGGSICEIYLSADSLGVAEAAKSLAALIDSGMPENYETEIDAADPDTISVTLGGEPWMEIYVEGEDDGSQVVVCDVDLTDAELDYLQENGVLPDPDAFGDLGIEVDPDEDFFPGN